MKFLKTHRVFYNGDMQRNDRNPPTLLYAAKCRVFLKKENLNKKQIIQRNEAQNITFRLAISCSL